MRVLLFLLAIHFTAHIAGAVGTKKKKQKVHVRREFVSFTQVQPPVEYHSAHDTFHSLRCKGTGLEGCGWRRKPLIGDKDFSLEHIDQMVARMRSLGAPSKEKPGLIEFNQHIRVQYWSLPNGYEYTVEEGTLAGLPEMDSLTRQIDSLARWHTGKPRAVIKF